MKTNLLLLFLSVLILLVSGCKKKLGEDNPGDTGMNDLFIYDVVNNTNRQITHTPEETETIYKFFHHRQSILFCTSKGTYSMNLDGSGKFHFSNDLSFANLTADDQTIIYNYSNNLWLINSDGSNARQFMHDHMNYLVPQWSPNGQMIACYNSSDSYLIALDHQVTIITSGLTQNSSWSSDSKVLLYQKPTGNFTEIYKYDLVTQKETQLTTLQRFSFSPVSNPFNGKIVFTSAIAPPDADLMVMNPDGGDQKSILHRNVADPCWSPDGNRLTFNLEGDIAICDANGSNLQVINEQKGKCHMPIWSPDGKYILYSRYSIPQ